MEEFGIGVVTTLGFEQAVMRARIALRTRGFSIISEMPAPKDLLEDTGRSHLFMSVWNPLVATSNLGGQGLDVGDHLQCHVVVYEAGGETVIASLDPTEGMTGWGEASGAAEDAKAALTMAFADAAGDPSEA